MKLKLVLVFILATCCGRGATSLAGESLSKPKADLVIINAKVWTGNPEQPTADTILISGERIVQVGSKDLIRELPSGQATVIDAKGRRIIPGLIDCHVHIISGGLTLTQLQLREATSKEDFVQRVKEWSTRVRAATAENQAATVRERSAWIIGRGWTIESWRNPEEPAKEWIDAVAGGRPAFLIRMDGHQAIVNSAALKLAGITKETPDPVGGQIVRDATTGEPTGILKDDAMDLVSKLIPDPTEEQKQNALQQAMELFNRHGVTMVHTMTDSLDQSVLGIATQLRRLRIYTFCQTDKWFSSSNWPKENSEPFKKQAAGGWLMRAGFKAYMDGSLGSKTAYMRVPFADNDQQDPNARGLLTPFATASEPDDMLSQFRMASRNKMQIAVHAIGDQANHLLLNSYEKLLKEFLDIRPRIEHAQHLLPEDIPRFAELGVIASMQPLHKADDGRYAEKRLGYERCKTSYAYRSLLDSGATVCFGSDWPVVSNNPFLGIEAAVTGKTLDGNIFVPEQNITVEQALKCYTVSAAYACFMEDRLGMIKPGYLADLVIIDQDILNIPVENIGATTVNTTIVGGKVVCQREAKTKK